MTSRASQHYPPRTASKPRLCTAGHKRPWKYRVPLAWIHSLLCLAGKITEHAYITTWVDKFCHVGGGIWLVIKCHAPFGLVKLFILREVRWRKCPFHQGSRQFLLKESCLTSTTRPVSGLHPTGRFSWVLKKLYYGENQFWLLYYIYLFTFYFGEE